MYFPSEETVERLRKEDPKGTRVELVRVDGPYTRLVPRDKRNVSDVEDAGTIFVAWDRGSSLGVAYGEDIIRKIKEKKMNPNDKEINISIRPMLPEERKYVYTQRTQLIATTGNIGHHRVDMDENGTGFYTSWDTYLT